MTLRMRSMAVVGLALLLAAATARPRRRRSRRRRRRGAPPLPWGSTRSCAARSRAGTPRSTVGELPPGLAKKQNGCLPPGQAKKRYAVGQPLGPGITFAPVPHELSVRIGQPPPGYLYGTLDGDLLKLAAGTLLVVDAIDGLVN